MKEKVNTFNLMAFFLSIIMILSVVSRFSFSITSSAIILLLLLIPAFFIFNNYKLTVPKYIIPLTAFVCACVVSLYGADCQFNVRDCLLFLFAACLAGINMSFVPFNLRKKLFIVPIFIALWLAMIIFTRFVTNINGFFTGDNFFETFAININIIAGFLVLIYPLLYIYIKEDFKTSKVYIFIALFILLAICITKSRTAIFLSFVATLLFLFEYKKNIYIKILTAIVSIVLISLIVYVSVLKSSSNSFSDRLIWWQTAYLIFKQHFLFGGGFCNYSILFKTFRPELVVNTLYAHNIIFQLLADTGIVGFGCFCWLMASFYKKVIFEIKNSQNKIYFKAIAVSITLFLLLNLDDYSFFIPANMLMFFVIFASVFDVNFEKLKKQKINNILLVIMFLATASFIIKPVIAQRYYKIGLDYYSSKRYMSANKNFQKAIMFDNKNSQYYYQLSNGNFSIFDQDRKNNIIYFDEAVRNTREALKYYKCSGQLWENLAVLYWNIEDKQNAVKYIKQAMAYDKFNTYYEQEYDKFTNY